MYHESDANAPLVAAAMRSWADRFTARRPFNAWDLYRRQQLSIVDPNGPGMGHGQLSGPGDICDTSFDSRYHPAIAQIRLDFEQHLNELHTEVALRCYYEDPVTGLRNERAAAIAPQDASKPMVPHFGHEGVKFCNDDIEKGGHNKADGLICAVAEAAHKIDPNVYRASGDFAVPVVNGDEGIAFLQLLRENLPEDAKGYSVSGAVGPNLARAREAHEQFKVVEVAAGRRASRGQRPFGLPRGQDMSNAISGNRVRAQLGVEHGKRFANLTTTRAGRDEVFRDIHVEESTGILTKQGFHARPPKKYRGSIDLNGLKRVQEHLTPIIGKEDAHVFGNLMLERFGRLAEANGGLDVDFAHEHGDEYLVQAEDELELKDFLEQLSNFAEHAHVQMRSDAPVGTWTYKALRFGFGTGETRDANAAEKALNVHKEDLARRGLRGNEDQPERLFFTPDDAGDGPETCGDTAKGTTI